MSDFKNIITHFDKNCLEKYPNPHNYGKIWQRTLCTLHVISKEANIDKLTCSEISNFLTQVIEINTSPQSVRYALTNLPRGLVNKNKSYYKIMEKGRKKLFEDIDKNNEIYIKSNSQFSSKYLLTNKVLTQLSGNIQICDPYIGPRIFDILLNVEKNVKIRILTATIEDKPIGNFIRTFNDFKKEGYDIEIRKYDKSKIHDRYIIDNNCMWIVGHSLKDLGNKECFIFETGKDLRDAVSSIFNRRWKISYNI